MKEKLPPGAVANKAQPVGYSDLDGRPAVKMLIREHKGHWYLYTGHFWHSGWSIVDVTDPAAPYIVKFIVDLSVLSEEKTSDACFPKTADCLILKNKRLTVTSMSSSSKCRSGILSSDCSQ